MNGALATTAVFLAGALALVAAVRAWRREPGWTISLGYLVLVTALFAPVVLGGRRQTPLDLAYRWAPWKADVAAAAVPQNRLLADGLLQMLPFRALVRDRLLHGEWPLWASELGTGQPLLGNGQSAPFAPLNLMALPLPAIDEQSAIGPWKVLLSLLLMHAWLAALGVPRWAAMFGALAFGLSPFTIAWLNHPHTAVSMWLPGILLGVLELGRAVAAGDRLRGAAGLVVCGLGAALGGHPETLTMLALAALGASVALGWWMPRRARGRFAMDLALAAGSVGLLAAPVLLPLLDAIPASQRAAVVAESPFLAQPPAFEPAILATLVQPNVLGNPVVRNWRGASNFNEVATAYAGLSTLALGLAAAFTRRRAAVVLAAAATALAVAFHVAPFWDLWFRVPGIGHGANGRLRLLWVFALATLAAWALGRAAVDAVVRRRLVVTCLLVLSIAPWFRPAPGDAWATATSIAALATVVAVLCAGIVPRLRPVIAAFAVLGLLCELAPLAARFQPAVPRAMDLQASAPLGALAPFAEHRIGRVLGLGETLHPNLAVLQGVWDVRGNDPMRSAAAARVVAAQLAPGAAGVPPSLQVRRLPERAALDAFAVRYVLTDRRAQMDASWVAIGEDHELRWWENTTAMELFYVAPLARTLAHPPRVVAAALREDLRRVTLRPGAPAADRSQAGLVRDVRAAASSFELHAAAAAPALVASSVSFDPGWRLRIDGVPAPVLDVNAGFLGFEVPAGEHALALEYRPRGWVVGRWLFAAGLALAFAWLGSLRRAARSS